MKCENCNGTGKIKLISIERRGVITEKIVDCFVCKGKGKIEEKKEEKEEKQSEEKK